MTQKPFIGVKHDGSREVFFAGNEPADESYDALYAIVIGPFRTAGGAEIVRDYGRGNPHVQTVEDAERIARSRRA